MSNWSATKAPRVYSALLKIGYSLVRQKGSHRVLSHPVRGRYVFAFHDKVEVGPVALKKIGDATGLTPEDL